MQTSEETTQKPTILPYKPITHFNKISGNLYGSRNVQREAKEAQSPKVFKKGKRERKKKKLHSRNACVKKKHRRIDLPPLPPPKEYQIQHHLNSGDPLKSLTDPTIHNLIFQHLTGPDVLVLFTLSKAWNRAASKSTKAMSKIVLRVDEVKAKNPFSANDFKELLTTPRLYQKMCYRLKSRDHVRSKTLLLQKLAPTLLELTFENPSGSVFYDSVEINKKKVVVHELPVLRTLKLRVANFQDARLLLLATTPRLTTLAMDTGMIIMFEQPVDPRVVPELVNLSLTRNFFIQNILHKPTTENFRKFLTDRFESLRFLKIELHASELSFILRDLPYLTTLHLNLVQDSRSSRVLELPTHECLKTLIHQGAVRDQRVFISLLNALVGLKTIKQYFTTNEEFENIYKHSKTLRRFYYVELLGGGGLPKENYRLAKIPFKNRDKTINQWIFVLKSDPLRWH